MDQPHRESLKLNPMHISFQKAAWISIDYTSDSTEDQPTLTANYTNTTKRALCALFKAHRVHLFTTFCTLL